MVIPSFTGFAATPNLAEAYLGGQRVRQEQQRIQQSAQQAAAELGVQRERLAQQAQMHEMELQAKEKVAEQENLRRQTELATEAAYKQATLGLRQAELEAQMAQQVAQRQQHQKDQAQSLELGVQGLNERARHNVAMEERSAGGGKFDPGQAEDVPNMPGHKRVWTGQSWQYLKDQGPSVPNNLDMKGGKVFDPSGAQLPNWISFPDSKGNLRAYKNNPYIPPELKEARKELELFEGMNKYLLTGDEPGATSLRKALPETKAKWEALKQAARGTSSPALPTSSATNALPRIRAIYQK